MHRSKRSPIWALLCVLLVAACRAVEPTATPVNSVATRSWLWRQSRPRRDLLRPKFCLMAHILHASSRSSHSQERK